MGSTHIKLTEERRERVPRAAREFFSGTLDEELSDFRNELLLDFYIKELGAPVYNQAIQDARASMQTKLEDLEGEFWEPESESDGPAG
jgi:uncharacterized protein (DUF2164 family)